MNLTTEKWKTTSEWVKTAELAREHVWVGDALLDQHRLHVLVEGSLLCRDTLLCNVCTRLLGLDCALELRVHLRHGTGWCDSVRDEGILEPLLIREQLLGKVDGCGHGVC